MATPGTPDSAPPFFVYPDAAYDQSSVLECFPHWRFDDQAAEVAALSLLRRHPSRVYDPAQAELFVVPLYPYVSSAAGECAGENHAKRMSRAAAALRHSEWFARKRGHDHMLVTNTFRVKTFGPYLKPLLANATVAWFEQPAAPSAVRSKGVLYSLAFWRCTVVVPYLANPFCELQRQVRGGAKVALASPSSSSSRGRRLGGRGGGSRRDRGIVGRGLKDGSGVFEAIGSEDGGSSSGSSGGRAAGSVFFQGSWQAATYLRKHFGKLQALGPTSHIVDVARGGCLRTNSSVAAAAAGKSASAQTDATAEPEQGGGGGGCQRGSRLQTARGMLSHEFCLIPRGDTPSSGRLFAALACRCVPILLSNRLGEHLPYPTAAQYGRWTVALSERDFLKAPLEALSQAIADARPKLPQMRLAMEAAAPELLYGVAGSRAAHNLLAEWRGSCGSAEAP